MRILIHTFGTRGDIQPYVALALRLKSAGHDVKIAAPSQFEAFVGSRSIAFAHLPGEMLSLMDTPLGRPVIGGSKGLAAGLVLLKDVRSLMRRLLHATWEASRTFLPDLIIYHPNAIGAPHIAERLRCPAILASPIPGFTPTSAFPSPLLPFNTAGPLNRMTHSVIARSGDFLFRSLIADWRSSELELPKRAIRAPRPAMTLYSYSPHVLPVPPDWVSDVAVTGYWFLDDDTDWQPSRELAGFLAEGDAPVYIGFGSMTAVDAAERLASIAVESLARANRRGVLATEGGALSLAECPPHVFVLEEAPHDKLFPLVAACVHNGGAGSTAASLRAGKPTVTCPFFGDQPFWARRVQQLGAGPRPLDRKTLSVETLAPAIGQATGDASIQWRAASIGEAIRAEDGVGAAVAIINQYFERREMSLAV